MEDRFFGLRSALRQRLFRSADPCPCCGSRLRRARPIIWNRLANDWNLTPELRRLMDQREGEGCPWCRANLRVFGVSRALLADIGKRIGRTWVTAREMVSDPAAKDVRIAEINMLPGLHRYIRKLPHCISSEYGGANSQNLMALTYADATFDYVLTSDTLEHVPDFDRALSEIRRVLRPGGKHVFTIPVIWTRATCERARMDGDKLVNLLPPSYHGGPNIDDWLVFNEFGGDVVQRIENAGFAVSLCKERGNEMVVTISAERLA